MARRGVARSSGHSPRTAPFRFRDEFGPEVVAIERGPGLLCVVNLGRSPVALPPRAVVHLLSTPLDEPRTGELPPDAAAWLLP